MGAAIGLAVAVVVVGCGRPSIDGAALTQPLRAHFPAQADRVLSGGGFAAAAEGFVPAPSSSWNPLAAAEASLIGRGGLRVRLPKEASNPFKFTLSSGMSIQVHEEGARGLSQTVGPALAWARDNGTAYWSANGEGYEEWLYFPTVSGATLATWRIEGATLRQAGEAIELVDTAGKPRIRVSAPEGYGPDGRLRHVWLVAQGESFSLRAEVAAGPLLVDPSWSSTPTSMTTPRYGHSATLLPTGQVLVTGGCTAYSSGGKTIGCTGYTSAAELYDPARGTWTSTAPMTTPRYFHSATLLQTGQVLIAGGQSTGGGVLSTAEIYDPVGGIWSAGGTLGTARYWHRATVLQNGQVLVVAGDGSGGSLSSAELYNPKTNLWSGAGSLTTARDGLTASLLPSGKVLVAGGYNGAGLSDTELYDPAAGTWSVGAPMSTGRAGATATLLPSTGNILVAGGYAGGFLSTAELYNPADGGWTVTGSMSTLREYASASLLPNGTVLVTGGENGKSGNTVTYTSTAEIYDPDAGTWSAAPSLATAVAEHTSTVLPGGRILVAGGYAGSNPYSTAEIYDYAVGSWSGGSAVTSARANHTATLLPSGMVLVIGGVENGTYLSDVELYDPISSLWSAVTPLPGPRANHTATLLQNGAVLVTGGQSSSVTVLSTSELYDPRSGGWTTLSSMTTPRMEHSATALPSGAVLVVGGCTASSCTASTSTAELFSPLSGAWSSAGALLSTARWNHTATLLNSGKVFVAGGQSSPSTATADSEIYDPDAGTWSAAATLGTGRAMHSATLLPSGNVLAVGGFDGTKALPSSEIYDPTKNTWSASATLGTARYAHIATLLLNGKVLVVSGLAGASSPLASAEIFDGLAGSWSPSGALPTAVNGNTATLLPSGQVLIAGGQNGTGTASSMAELFDEGRGAHASWTPTVDGGLPHTPPGGTLGIGGSLFTGPSEGSSNTVQSSATNYPVIDLEEQENQGKAYAPLTTFNATSATLTLPKSLLPGWYWLRAIVNGVPSAGQSLLVTGPPSQLVFATGPQTVMAGACSGPVTVQTEDASGNVVNTTSALTVTLNGSPATATYYSGPGCTGTAVTSVAIPGGSNSASFSFKENTAGSLAITASSSLTSPTQTETITASTASQLVFSTGAQAIGAGACSGIATVQAEDGFANAANVSAATTVNLSGSPATGLTFYTNATCTTAATSVTIAAGTSTASFYFKDTTAGSLVITAAAVGLNSPTQTETIQAGSAATLVFTTAAQTVAPSACSGITTVQSQDSFGNPAKVAAATAVTLSSTPATGVTFYSDATCTTAVTGVTIAANTNSASFYFKDATSGSLVVTASSSLASPAQTETIGSSTTPQLVFATAPQSLTSGTCSSPVTVNTQQGGGVYFVPSATNVNLTSSPPGITFYTDAACTAQVTFVTIPSGGSSTSFFFKGSTAGSMTVTASATGFTSSSQTETITAGTAVMLAFTTTPQSLAAGSCSGATTVQSQDSSGNPANVAAATLVNLSGSPATGLTFYSDLTCSTAVTSVSIAANSATATFYFKDTTAGSVVLTAASSLGSPTQTETITGGGPVKLAFTSAPQTVVANACSGAATVQSQDTYGNPSNLVNPTTVTFSGSPATFYSDASCTTAITSLSMPAGSKSASFYFKDTTAGSVTITATSSLSSPTQTETITAAGAAQLVFATAPQTLGAGACSQIVTLQAKDAYGNVSNVSAATTVSLSGSPPTGLIFYSNATCTAAIASTSIAVGTSTASFYFKDTAAGALTVTASSSLSSPTQPETINALNATQLAFTTAPQTVTAGICSGIATLQSEDTYGNPSNVSAATTVTLSGSPATGLTFYSDATCATAVTSATIAAAANTASFYFKDTAAVSLVVTAASSLSSPTQAETINASNATQLVFNTAPQTVTAGLCSGIATVQAEDTYNNPTTVSAATTVTLSGTPSAGLTFFTDPACSISATTTTLAAASSTASFYFKDTAAGSVVVTASSSLTSPTQSETINASNATQLVFSTAAQTINAGACSGIATVQAEDTYGNPANVSTATTVTLSGSPSTGLTFSSDATCATPVTSATLAAATRTASFYFKDTTAGSVVITAASTLGSPTQSETVNAIAPSKLVFSSAAQTITAGNCSGVASVQAEDTYGNPSNVSAATTVTLSGSPSTGLTFYSDATCTTAVTSVTIAAAASSAKFNFKDTSAGTVVVTAASSLGSPTQSETINASNATQLVFSTAAQTVTAGNCSGIATVQAKDTYNNPTTVSAATTVTLSGSPLTGLAFFSDATCATAVTSTTLAAGTGNAGFYFKDTAAGSVVVTASSSLTSPTQSETINASNASQLVFSTAAQTLTAGNCSGIATLQAKDTYGNPANVSAATAVTLSGTPSAGLAFYSDATCATAVTSATIAAAANTASFYFKDTAAGSLVVTAASSLGSPTQAETITASNATQLVFSTAAQTLAAGNCSGIATLQAKDTYGNPANVSAATAVTLSGTPSAGLTFYSDATCATAVTSTTLAAASSTASFYFKDTAAGPVVVTAASSLGSPTQTETITAGPASKLVFTTAAQSLGAGVCSGIATVQAEDTYGNPSNVSVGMTIALSASPAAGMTFYSGTGCATAASSISLAAGTSSASFSFQDTAAGSVVLAAASNLGSPTQAETISAGSASQLVFLTPAQSVAAGSCSGTVTVQSEDTYGNVASVSAATAVTLSGSPAAGLNLYSGAGCATAGTSISLAAGTSSASFSFQDTLAGTVVLTAASSLGSPTQSETLQPGPTAAFRMGSFTPQPVTAGQPGTFTATAVDAYGNVTPAYHGTGHFTSIDLKAVLPADYTFTATDQGSRSFSATLETVGTQSITLTDTAQATVTGTLGNLQVVAGNGQNLVVSGIPSPVNTGTASAVTVTLKDAYGNVATGYTGTVHFSATDPAATLPADYTFTSTDSGQHLFPPGVTFQTVGTQTVTVSDSAHALSGAQSVQVNLAPPAIVPDAILTAGVGFPYPYNVPGRILTTGGAPTSYGSCAGPTGFTVDAVTGVVSWTPSATGAVNLCVSATNSAGTGTHSFTVQVSQPVGNPPTASFTATPSSGSAPLAVAFDGAASTADPTTTLVAYRWSYGDGAAPGYGVTPSHRYTLAGGYPAQLVVVDGYGRTGSASQAVEVLSATGQRPPTAAIVASTTSGPAPLAVNFSCNCQAGSAPIVSWRWEAGAQVQTGLTPTFTFANPGTQQVTLVVTDANGLTATDSAEIVVQQASLSPPTCAVYATPSSGAAPLSVVLTTDVRPGSGTVTKTTLTLFDGTTTGAPQANQTVTKPGYYQALLQATDSNQLTCSASVTVTAFTASGLVPPRIVSLPDSSAFCGVDYRYQAVAAGTEPFTWSVAAPDGGTSPFSVDAGTGLVAVTPRPDQLPLAAVLTVRNPAGQDVQPITLNPQDCLPHSNVGGCGCHAAGGALPGLALVALLALTRRRRPKVLAQEKRT